MTEITTTVINNSTTTIDLQLCRSLGYKIRAGERKDLPLDIWSVMDRGTKYKVQGLESRGVLTITTNVCAGDRVITVAGENGDISIHNGPLAVPEEKKKVYMDGTKSIPDVRDMPNLFTTPSKVIDVKNASKMGFAPVSEDTPVKVADSKSGFASYDMKGTTGLFHNQKNTEPANTTSLFGRPQTPAVTVEEPAEDPAPMEISGEELIEQLIANGDVDALLTELKKEYPGKKFTKAGLKSCKSLDDIKAKFSL